MDEPTSTSAPGSSPHAGAHIPTVERPGFHVTASSDSRLIVSGELDANSVAVLRTALARAFDEDPERVVVDLSKVSFIDSVGVSVLVTAHNRGESQTTPFEVHASSPACMRVFEITRLVDVFRLT